MVNRKKSELIFAIFFYILYEYVALISITIQYPYVKSGDSMNVSKQLARLNSMVYFALNLM